jgi:hypothetical protein
MTTIENLKTIGWSSPFLAQPPYHQLCRSVPIRQRRSTEFESCLDPLPAIKHAILEEHEFKLTYLVDPFAEADEDTGQVQQSQQYIHIRIQRMFQSSNPGIKNSNRMARAKWS